MAGRGHPHGKKSSVNALPALHRDPNRKTVRGPQAMSAGSVMVGAVVVGGIEANRVGMSSVHTSINSNASHLCARSTQAKRSDGPMNRHSHPARGSKVKDVDGEGAGAAIGMNIGKVRRPALRHPLSIPSPRRHCPTQGLS